MEAGEWGLIDFQRKPSDRLQAAAHVAGMIEKNSGFFSRAETVYSDVTVLYNNESIWTQKRNSLVIPGTEHEGRMASAVMKSLASAYKSIAAHGITPQVASMDEFDWKGAPGRVAVIPNMVSLPSRLWDLMREFVSSGGRLVVTGMSGYYDENMYCLFMNGFPLSDLFGGSVSEFKYVADEFYIPGGEYAPSIPAHMWKGIIRPGAAATVALDRGDVVATSNMFGNGDVIWIPSLVDLGGWLGDNMPLQDFYGRVCKEALDKAAVRFNRPASGVLMRSLRSGNDIMTILVNKNKETARIELAGKLGAPEKIDGEFKLSGREIELPSESYAVIIWSSR